jgi:signal transduction histidine kinase
VTLSPLPGEAGQPPGLACLFTDLSDVVALQEQLLLKDALARLGELTAGIAHEFRNGLATIHGYARLLDPGQLPAPQGGYVQGIRDETQALGEVVTRFLQFARPERPNLQPTDLAAVVTRAVADTDAANAAVVVEGAFGWIDGDDVLLRQAFANLLRNALEACTTAGVPPQVRVVGEPRPSEGVVRVTVRDNGPGLPAEGRDRLFQPFVTTRSRGTGLGLALVQKFVVIHDGQVRAGDAPGGGAEFVVQLPLRAGGAPANPPRR